MTKQELENLVNTRLNEINVALNTVPDEMAINIVTLFEQWEPDKDYIINQRLRYNNKLYRVVQAHHSQTGWEPNLVSALFTEITMPGEIPEWRQPTGAQDAYMKGDQVKYDGKIWESQYDNNTWQPGVFGWVEV